MGLLEALERHDIRAVGLVTWGNVRSEADLELLEMWLAAGHELGNHSYRHLSYTSTDVETYLADIERARTELLTFLDPRDAKLRFFRFPMLREGDTPAKLEAMRHYLERTGQRNLPVTIDNQDWSFARPWVEAQRAGDEARLVEIGNDYQAALHIAVKHHERVGDRLFGRPLPQILLLHANAVGAAEWDRLFTWMTENGYRFADVDSVLADPVFAEQHAYVGPRGFGLWDRLAVAKREEDARRDVQRVLDTQAAAWTRGDLETFCSVYTDDARYLSPSRTAIGRGQILAQYLERYPTRAAMGRLTLEIVDFRAASGTEVSMLGDARPSLIHGASVIGRWRLAYKDREEASGLTLLVLRPTTDGWKIVQDASF